METIHNVAIAGASGALGTAILQALLHSNLFNITILSRQSSKSQFPTSTKVIHVDYTSITSLTTALTGQDAIISALTTNALESQIPLITAASKANVKRFLPSEFCANISNPRTASLPVYAPKLAIHNILKQESTTNPDFSYTLLRTGPFLDWSLAYGFFFALKGGPTPFYDGGNRPFSTTTLATIGRAVVAILGHLDETRNRAVFVHDVVTTQREMVDIARRVRPECVWMPVCVRTVEMERVAREKFEDGIVGLEALMGFFCRAVFGDGFGGVFEVDNEVLGIGMEMEGGLEGLVRGVLDGQ